MWCDAPAKFRKESMQLWLCDGGSDISETTWWGRDRRYPGRVTPTPRRMLSWGRARVASRPREGLEGWTLV